MYFEYGEKETEYLKAKDPRLAEIIDRIGHISREVDTDLYASVVHNILGQQISTKAEQTLWSRAVARYKVITPEVFSRESIADIQSLGTTYRKAEYIKDFTDRIVSGSFDLEAVKEMSDQDAIAALSSLKGIGVWTAEMLLLFCLQRPNVFSYGDLAIQRGLRMVHHHRKITPGLFEKYRRRYSPYCSVASLYLWEVAGGAVEGMKDYAPKKGKTR